MRIRRLSFEFCIISLTTNSIRMNCISLWVITMRTTKSKIFGLFTDKYMNHIFQNSPFNLSICKYPIQTYAPDLFYHHKNPSHKNPRILANSFSICCQFDLLTLFNIQLSDSPNNADCQSIKKSHVWRTHTFNTNTHSNRWHAWA